MSSETFSGVHWLIHFPFPVEERADHQRPGREIFTAVRRRLRDYNGRSVADPAAIMFCNAIILFFPPFFLPPAKCSISRPPSATAPIFQYFFTSVSTVVIIILPPLSASLSCSLCYPLPASLPVSLSAWLLPQLSQQRSADSLHIEYIDFQ